MSLLEALVALAVVGLMGVLAFPHLERPYHVLDIRSGAQTLAIDLRRTRAAALRSGKEVSLVRAKGSLGYILADGSKRTLPSGVTLKGRGVSFFPDGTATGGAFEVSGRAKVVQVVVAPATGAVLVVVP